MRMKKIISKNPSYILRAFQVFLFALVVGCFTLTGFAQGGFSYIFPGITLNNTITIGNLNPQATTASIAFYDNSAKLIRCR